MAKHNTLLHVNGDSETRDHNRADKKEAATSESATAVVTHTSSTSVSKYVSLSTAVVYVYDSNGFQREGRVLLDCGSQVNFISPKFLSFFGLEAKQLNVSISGVNGTVTNATQSVRLKIQSRLNSFSMCIDCIVSDRITNELPGFNFKRNTYDLPAKLKLADPQFYRSSEVDILIGAEVFWDLLCVGATDQGLTEVSNLAKNSFRVDISRSS